MACPQKAGGEMRKMRRFLFDWFMAQAEESHVALVHQLIGPLTPRYTMSKHPLSRSQRITRKKELYTRWLMHRELKLHGDL